MADSGRSEDLIGEFCFAPVSEFISVGKTHWSRLESWCVKSEHSRRHLGNIGGLIIVEGEVVRVDYAGRGKSRRGRYVIHTADVPVIYDGPALLVGRRLELVRFTATIQSLGHDAGQLATVVENARDVVMIQKPRSRKS